MSAKIMRFPEQETTVGDLINRAERISAFRVMAELRRHFGKADKLDRAGEHGAEFKRNLIIAACLLNRVIFEIHPVPKDIDARI